MALRAAVMEAVRAPWAMREITKGGAYVAIDALGIEATCVNAIRGLRARGRHLQIGLTSSAERGKIALPIDLIVG